jgi:protein tyrosine/serine phosphatase
MELPLDKTIIRSDCPFSLTEEELNWLKDHNVTTAIDLRRVEEVEKLPCCLANIDGFTYENIPITAINHKDTYEDMIKVYINMVDENLDKALDEILNAENGVIYFCHVGKDRTGVVSAILEKKFGFSMSYIKRDYCASDKNLIPFYQKFLEENPNRIVITPYIPCIRAALNEYFK